MATKRSKPHYIVLAQQLMADITEGRYPVGSLLPTELQLCEQFDTSRHTVRAALNELQQLGLVQRRKNVGTRVIAAQARQDFQPTLASVDDLVQFGAAHERVVQHSGPVQATAALARTLGCAPGTDWWRIASLRLEGGRHEQPIGWTDVYVEPEYAAIADEVRAQPGTLVSTLIERRYGRRIAEIRQEICACTITEPALAEALRLPVGTAALRIVRHYLDSAGQAFEVSVTLHPAERFSVVLQLRRSPQEETAREREPGSGAEA